MVIHKLWNFDCKFWKKIDFELGKVLKKFYWEHILEIFMVFGDIQIWDLFFDAFIFTLLALLVNN